MGITTQEGIDGYRGKAMRIASVEQVELSSTMEWTVSGHVLRWATPSKLSGGAPLSRANGWNLKNQCYLTIARHMRVRIQPNFLVVTLREGEEGGICSAASKEHVNVIEDQVQGQSVCVCGSRNPESGKHEYKKRCEDMQVQLKYIDVGEVRVVTTNRCVAEQIEGEKLRTPTTGCVKIEELGKVHKSGNSKNIVIDGARMKI